MSIIRHTIRHAGRPRLAGPGCPACSGRIGPSGMSSSTVSPEVQAHADREQRRKLTRAARAWMATFVLGALLWAGLIFAGLKAAEWLR